MKEEETIDLPAMPREKTSWELLRRIGLHDRSPGGRGRGAERASERGAAANGVSGVGRMPIALL